MIVADLAVYRRWKISPKTSIEIALDQLARKGMNLEQRKNVEIDQGRLANRRSHLRTNDERNPRSARTVKNRKLQNGDGAIEATVQGGSPANRQ